MIDYLRTYYAEYYNDYIESDEFIALLDVFSFAAQGLAFRTDLNARENFLSTAERRDSVLKLVKQLGYSPNRNVGASGFLKIASIATTDTVFDSNGTNLSNQTIVWNDATNNNWSNQFTVIMNSALNANQTIGKPYASKLINNILTYQYNMAIPKTILPVFSFTAPIQDQQSPFAILSANILNSNAIVEQDPGHTGSFGLIYQNDGAGNSSPNTGFFCLFKQGVLNTQTFNFTQAIPNTIYPVNADNINNSDLWLYDTDNGQIANQWTMVNNANGGINSIYNNIASSVRTIYSVNSRANDQVDLVFGDGTFSQIPTGNFVLYYRTTNGLTYRLSPSAINNITVTIPYINKNGESESLTMTLALQYTVSNASKRDTIDDIKNKAPQFVYSQNRMVNGEDYNSFPYTQYSDIVKVKSVVRFASGVSRQIDIVDPTSRYSSTDIFASDGCLYKEDNDQVFSFTSVNNAQTITMLNTQLIPILKSNQMQQFYFTNYEFVDFRKLAPTWWTQVTGSSGSCTGFFLDQNNSQQQIGVNTSSLRQTLIAGALIRFDAPTGFYFDGQNNLVPGASSQPNARTTIWSTITSQVGNGSTSMYYAGREIGGVTLSDNIPSTAIVVGAYCAFNTSFSNLTINSILASIANNIEFSLTYNSARLAVNQDPWVYCTISNTNQGPFDLSTMGSANDASWLVLFKVNNGQYTVTCRGLNYIFASESQVLFSPNNTKPIFDYQTNTLIQDYINILPFNGIVDEHLANQTLLNVSGIQVASDGYTDNSKVQVTFNTKTRNQTPVNPTVFQGLFNNVNNIYLKSYIDYDNLIRFKVLPSGTVIDSLSTITQIQALKNNFNVGTIFYTSSDEQFYTVTSVNGYYSVTPISGYEVRSGRQDIMFQYRHNADSETRLDPAVSNLIDCYIITRSYDDAYRSWLADTTNTVSQPVAPNANDIETTYAGIFDYKMMTDQMIMSFGKYKPLFGAKADVSLQATIQIVPVNNVTISGNEIKSLVVNAINDYFVIGNWNFGDTFYFSELSAYIHQTLGQYVSSVLLVPNVASTFGSLYEILSEPNEIFISATTVDDIDIVTNTKIGFVQSGQITSTIGIGS
jgi:hypothetical protein